MLRCPSLGYMGGSVGVSPTGLEYQAGIVAGPTPFDSHPADSSAGIPYLTDLGSCSIEPEGLKCAVLHKLHLLFHILFRLRSPWSTSNVMGNTNSIRQSGTFSAGPWHADADGSNATCSGNISFPRNRGWNRLTFHWEDHALRLCPIYALSISYCTLPAYRFETVLIHPNPATPNTSNDYCIDISADADARCNHLYALSIAWLFTAPDLASTMPLTFSYAWSLPKPVSESVAIAPRDIKRLD